MEVEAAPDARETDVEAILAQLKSLSEQLKVNNEKNDTTKSLNNNIIQSDIQQLQESHPTNAILHVLVPYLFLPTGEAQHPNALTNSEALHILVALVTAQSQVFLKPASRSLRRVAEQWNANNMSVSDELTHTLVAQISSPDVEVSANATATLVACCQKASSSLNVIAESILRASVETVWKPVWQQLSSNRSQDRTTDSTLCVRHASLAVDLLVSAEQNSNSGSAWRAAQDGGALSLLLEMLQFDEDPLLQMSILDLLERLATQATAMSHERGQWLFSNNVLEPLLGMAGGREEDGEPDPILGGPALRVVAALCKSAGLGGSETDATTNWFQLTDSSQLLEAFHRALQKFDTHTELDRLAVVDAVSAFATASPQALDMLLHNPQTRDAWLSLNVAQSKLKAAILGSISMVLRHEYQPREDPQRGGGEGEAAAVVVSLKKQLYVMIARVNKHPRDDTTNLVVNSLVRSPFPEVRLAAYALLTAVVENVPTGAQILLQNTEFFRLVVGNADANNNSNHQNNDHSLEERTKEGREARYGVIVAVCNSPAKGLLADPIVQQLERRIQQGPHYVPTQTFELATEQ